MAEKDSLVKIESDCIDCSIIRIAHNVVPNNMEKLGDVQCQQQRFRNITLGHSRNHIN